MKGIVNLIFKSMIETHKIDQLEVLFHILLSKTKENESVFLLLFFYLRWKPIVKIRLKVN